MTPKQSLLELMNPTVPALVAESVAAGKSWRTVSDEVSALVGVTISHESLRQWYGAERAA